MTAPLIIRPGTSDKRVFRDIWYKEKYKPDVDVEPEYVLDLGAYTGISTRYFQKLWPDATVIAVEPDPRSAALLRLNAPTAEIHEVGVAAETHYAKFSMHSEPWRSSVEADGRVCGVKLTVVGEVLSGRQPQVVKVDIEGAEGYIFATDCDWIHGVKVLFVETHDRFVDGCKDALDGLLERQSRDYRIENRGGEDYMIVFDG